MKIRGKITTVIMIVLLSLLCSSNLGCGDSTKSKRFEYTHMESYENDTSTAVNDIEVWHDKETGKEYVCFIIHRAGSCVETKSPNNLEHKEKE